MSWTAWWKSRRGDHVADQRATVVGQVRSLLSLISYLGSGEYRERYLGVKIPPTNLQEHHLAQARGFADALANRLPEAATTAG